MYVCIILPPLHMCLITIGKNLYGTYLRTYLACHKKTGPPIFSSPQSKYIEIFGPPG